MAEKFLNYSDTALLWKRINKLLDKKMETVENADDSIVVTNKNKIAVRVSPSEKNLLKLKQGEGLYVPSMQKLKFGADQVYEYDGSKEVLVPVYKGEVN